MRQKFERDDEIARFAAVLARVTVAALSDIAVGIAPRGDIEREFGRAAVVTFAAANGTLFGNLFARAAAGIARFHLYRSENTASRNDLNAPRALALFASGIRRAVFRARTLTSRARFAASVRYGLFAALCRVEKRQFDLYVDVGTLFLRRLLTARTAAEARKEIAENIAETGKTAEALSTRKTAEIACPRIVEFIVVCGAFLLVGQSFVRLVYLLEFGGSRLVVGMKIGVILFDEFAVCRLYLFLRCLAVNTQYFIIILRHNLFQNRRFYN